MSDAEKKEGPVIHEIRMGDQARVVMLDPRTGEEVERSVVLAVIIKPDDSQWPLALPMGENVHPEVVVAQAQLGNVLQRVAFLQALEAQAMQMVQGSELSVPGMPGHMTPGGVAVPGRFVPGPPPGRHRKQ